MVSKLLCHWGYKEDTVLFLMKACLYSCALAMLVSLVFNL